MQTGVQTTLARCDAVAQELDGYLGLDYVGDDYIRFKAALIQAYRAVADKINEHSLAASRPAPQLAMVMNIDRTLLAELFDQLVDITREYSDRNDFIARLAISQEHNPDLLTNITGCVLDPDSELVLAAIANGMGADVGEVKYVGTVLASPFAVIAAQPHLESDGLAISAGATGRCPVCTGLPGFAKLRRSDGKRILYCSMCGVGWEFARIKCPSCGSEEQAKLRILMTDDIQPVVVETCEECKNYIKSVDERHLPEDKLASPFVLDTVTLYLDLIAEREGYTKPWPFAAVV